jgi:hypothetical protein
MWYVRLRQGSFDYLDVLFRSPGYSIQRLSKLKAKEKNKRFPGLSVDGLIQRAINN